MPVRYGPEPRLWCSSFWVAEPWPQSEIIYHLVAKQYQWFEWAPEIKAAYLGAREKVIQHVRTKTSLMNDTFQN